MQRAISSVNKLYYTTIHGFGRGGALLPAYTLFVLYGKILFQKSWFDKVLGYAIPLVLIVSDYGLIVV